MSASRQAGTYRPTDPPLLHRRAIGGCWMIVDGGGGYTTQLIMSDSGLLKYVFGIVAIRNGD